MKKQNYIFYDLKASFLLLFYLKLFKNCLQNIWCEAWWPKGLSPHQSINHSCDLVSVQIFLSYKFLLLHVEQVSQKNSSNLLYHCSAVKKYIKRTQFKTVYKRISSKSYVN